MNHIKKRPQRRVKNHIRLEAKSCGIALAALCFMAPASAQAESYQEKGQQGNPASWHSNEFRMNWGIGAVHAEEAYAAGFTGKGIKIGIFDQAVYKNHPEFSGQGKINNLVTQGIREYTDPHNKDAIAGDRFYYDGTPGFNYTYPLPRIDSHGTSVASVAAANRDGSVIHGVAFNAQIVTAETGDPGPEDSIVAGNDGGVYRAGWDALIASGVPIINNSWGIGIPKEFSGWDPARPQFALADAQKQFDQIKTLLGTRAGGAYQGAIDAAHSGIMLLFGAGNDSPTNAPDALAGLPRFLPDVAPNWLAVTSVMPSYPDEDSYQIEHESSRCGYAASFCVSAPGSYIPVASIAGNSISTLTNSYGAFTGTSLAAPHAAGSLAVLMERFPYLNGARLISVLRTTATDLGAPGIDEIYGWGMVNLGKAIHGPSMLVTEEDIPAEFRIQGAYGDSQFVVNMIGQGGIVDAGKPTERVCEGVLCDADIWDNDISGHGGLTKEGRGMLTLTGNNTYSGPTLVNQGTLTITGKLASDVAVFNGGILSGNGTAASVRVHSGGAISPSTNTITFDNNVIFDAGSHYQVAVTAEGISSRIHSLDSVMLNGGEMNLLLEDSNGLAAGNLSTLLNQNYDILTSANGISGQFSTLQPNYLFIDDRLSYATNKVTLSLNRNDTTFANVAANHNQRSAAAAAEDLGAGNALYESLLLAKNKAQIQQTFQQMSGQIHADIGSALLNDSHHLRDSMNERLRQLHEWENATRLADKDGAWVQLQGSWAHASGDSNATAFNASTYGILLGLDGALDESKRLGLATGYTRTALSGGYGSKAHSDNYHLGLYGDKNIGALSLRAGAGSTWHRIDTSRSLAYGQQSQRYTAKYGARTGQLFAEAGYQVQQKWFDLQPFANLAYTNIVQNRIGEGKDAAALHSNRQHTDATLSTVGLRVSQQWQMDSSALLALRSELGWQHQYGDVERDVGLRFTGGTTAFTTRSVPVSNDGMVLKAAANLEIDTNAVLSLGYAGLLSQQYQDNSVTAGFSWHF